MNLFEFYRKIQLRFFRLQTTYSQAGEDLILQFLFDGKNYGTYVDIGANDPKKFNNTYLLYKQGWKGFNIEPNKIKHKQLLAQRKRDVNLNIGLSSRQGSLSFHIFKEDTLSTFDKKIADSYVTMGHTLLATENIPTLSLVDFFNTFTKETPSIDFLTIDTEGYDLEILKSNDWNKFRPHIILIETLEYDRSNGGKKTVDQFDEYMNSIEYTQIADTYLNTFYKDNRK